MYGAHTFFLGNLRRMLPLESQMLALRYVSLVGSQLNLWDISRLLTPKVQNVHRRWGVVALGPCWVWLCCVWGRAFWCSLSPLVRGALALVRLLLG